MPEIDGEIVDFLEDNSGDWFSAEDVMHGIENEYSEGYVLRRLDTLEESNGEIEDNYWNEEIFGYFLGDRFIPSNRENLVEFLAGRVGEDVHSLSLSELRSLAEDIANPATVNVDHRDFRYDDGN